MSRMLRYQPVEWSVHFVTLRCIQGRYLLRPDDRVNALIVGILERAAKQAECRLHGVVVLSNHLHLVVSSRTATELANYMEYVGGNIAREIGKHHDWPGKFWDRRYAAALCLEDAAQVDRLAYLMSNSVKEGLVKHARRWPGLHCYEALCEGKKLRGKWVDRTALYRARLKWREGDPKPTERDHTETCTLTLHPLPCWADLTPDSYAAQVRDLYDETIKKVQPAEGVKPRGRKRLLRTDPHKRPAGTDRTPAPRCHTGSKERRREFLAAYREFARAFRAALAALRDGLKERDFPLGCVLPGGLRLAPT